jgi:hypothetical protein
MKLDSYLTGIVLVNCVLYSCSNLKPAGVDFTEESFSESFHIADGRIYKNDSLFIGKPMWIKFHPDSFLILQDMGTPKLVKIIDLKSNKIQEVIPQGKGPGEMVVAWGIEILGNDLFVLDGQLRKILVFTPDINRKFRITDEFSLDEKQTTGFYPLKKDLLVCLSSTGDDKRLTFLNNDGKIIKKLGDYPPILNSDRIKSNNDIFYSLISATPDGNKFVLACTDTDVLEIYDTDKGLVKRFQGPLGIQLTITRRNVGIGTMMQREPWYRTYGMVDANENEFWAGYSGYQAEKGIRPSPVDSYLKQIFCFDWEGNPLRRIDFDNPFLAFDVDWNGKVFYSLIWQDESPEIISYSLNSILK